MNFFNVSDKLPQAGQTVLIQYDYMKDQEVALFTGTGFLREGSANEVRISFVNAWAYGTLAEYDRYISRLARQLFPEAYRMMERPTEKEKAYKDKVKRQMEIDHA